MAWKEALVGAQPTRPAWMSARRLRYDRELKLMTVGIGNEDLANAARVDSLHESDVMSLKPREHRFDIGDAKGDMIATRLDRQGTRIRLALD